GTKVPVRITTTKHGGASSIVLGATTANSKKEPNGDSFAYESITIPAGAKSATLSFWYSTYTTDTIQYDWQEARIMDANGNTLAQIFKLAANNPAWVKQTFDLTPYAGRTIRV